MRIANVARYLVGLAIIATPVIAISLASVSAQAQSARVVHSPEQMQQIARGLDPRGGSITIEEAKAVLNLGNAYQFYGPEDARTILVDLWGNPPGAADDVLGLVMPAGKGPLTDSWGAVITFEESGYVSDSDANSTDYDELMETMQSGEGDANAERVRQGYPTIHLVGWADAPKYDPQTHSVVWARNLDFSDSQLNGLNYDVRVLGRRGVLSLNLVSSMNKLDEVRHAAANFASHAQYIPGERYADYDSSTDRAAEYGIGGLVAAGVGVGVAKKLGFLVIFAKFGKIIVLGAIAMLAAFRQKIAALFGRRDDNY